MRVALFAAMVGMSAARTLVFNAEHCNTNLNNEANYYNPDLVAGQAAVTPSNVGAAAPSTVKFEGLDGSFGSIDVKVNKGEYTMKRMQLRVGMELSLDQGVEINFNEASSGGPAVFTAGQTTTDGKCSIGCHSNFVEYIGIGGEAGAAEVDLKRYEAFKAGEVNVTDPGDMIENAEAPCGSDVLVIPKEYNVNLNQFGFHVLKRLAYYSGDALYVVDHATNLPSTMWYPRGQGLLYIGDKVTDTCQSVGFLNSQDQCVCSSECPADEAQAVADAVEIRDAQQTFARASLVNFERVDEFEVEYVYRDTEGWLDAANCEQGDVSSNKVDRYMREDYTAGQYTTDTDKIIFRLDPEEKGWPGIKQVEIRTTLVGIRGIVSAAPGRDDEVTFYPGREYSYEANIPMALFEATLKAAVVANCLSPAGYAQGRKLIGAREEVDETYSVYVGNNMPQMDVNALANDDNKEGVVTAVLDELIKIEGFSSLSPETMLENWVLVSPEERAVEQANGGGTWDAGAAGPGRSRRAAHAISGSGAVETTAAPAPSGPPIRYGLATNLIRVTLEYSRFAYGPPTPNGAYIAKVVNHVLATYDTVTHHDCFTFGAGFDDDCVNSLVAEIIATELAKCDKSRVAECRDEAANNAANQILTIKGCGLLGKDPNGECHDPGAAAAAKAQADTGADAAVGVATAAIEAEYNLAQAELRAQEIAAAIKAQEEAAELQRILDAANDAENARHFQAVQQAKIEAFSEAAGITNVTKLREELAVRQATYDAAYNVVQDQLGGGEIDKEAQRALELADAALGAFKTVEEALSEVDTAALAAVDIANAAAASRASADLQAEIAELKEKLAGLNIDLSTAAAALDDAEASANAAKQASDNCRIQQCNDQTALDTAAVEAADAAKAAKDTFNEVQKAELQIAAAEKDEVVESSVGALAKIQQVGKLAATGDATKLDAEVAAAEAELVTAQGESARLQEELKKITDKPESQRSYSERLTALVLDLQVQKQEEAVSAIQNRLEIAGTARQAAVNEAAQEKAFVEQFATDIIAGTSILITVKDSVSPDLANAASELDDAKAQIALCTASGDCLPQYVASLEATQDISQSVFDALKTRELESEAVALNAQKNQITQQDETAEADIAAASNAEEINELYNRDRAVELSLGDNIDKAKKLIAEKKAALAANPNSEGAAFIEILEALLAAQENVLPTITARLAKIKARRIVLDPSAAPEAVKVAECGSAGAADCTADEIDNALSALDTYDQQAAAAHSKSSSLVAGTPAATSQVARDIDQKARLVKTKNEIGTELGDQSTAPGRREILEKQLDVTNNEIERIDARISRLTAEGKSGASAGSETAESDSLPIPIIAGAAAIVVLCIILVIYIKATAPSGASATPKSTVAFENPVYDEGQGKENPMYDDDKGKASAVATSDGLYDEPTVGAPAGGYLDVEPESDDDDDDDSDSDE